GLVAVDDRRAATVGPLDDVGAGQRHRAGELGAGLGHAFGRVGVGQQELHAGAPKWLIQWRAIASRRANQTPPRSRMCSSPGWRAPMRPGRPIIRRCRPTDSSLGADAPSRHSVSKASFTYSVKSRAVTKRWRPWWKCMSLVSKL